MNNDEKRRELERLALEALQKMDEEAVEAMVKMLCDAARDNPRRAVELGSPKVKMLKPK